MHPIGNRRLLGLGELVKKIETSASALKKRIRTARKKAIAILREHRRIARKKGLYAICVTLTYRDNEDFAPRQLARFLAPLRRKLQGLGYSLPYLWTLERAEKLHYHLLLWLPRGFILDHKDRNRWWTWGLAKTESCRRPTAWTNYITKCETKEGLPPSAKAFGSGGTDALGEVNVRRTMLPQWLKRMVPRDVVPRRGAGGWMDLCTGELFPSPWKWTSRGFVLKAPLMQMSPAAKSGQPEPVR